MYFCSKKNQKLWQKLSKSIQLCLCFYKAIKLPSPVPWTLISATPLNPMRGKRLQIPIIGPAASRTAAVFYDPKISDGVAVSVLSTTGPTHLPTVTSQVSTRPVGAIVHVPDGARWYPTVPDITHARNVCPIWNIKTCLLLSNCSCERDTLLRWNRTEWSLKHAALVWGL